MAATLSLSAVLSRPPPAQFGNDRPPAFQHGRAPISEVAFGQVQAYADCDAVGRSSSSRRWCRSPSDCVIPGHIESRCHPTSITVDAAGTRRRGVRVRGSADSEWRASVRPSLQHEMARNVLLLCAIEGIFGDSIEGVHLGLVLVNVGAMILIYLIARRIFDASAAVAAAVAYGILSLGPATEGFAGHATHFVVLSALAAIVCLESAFGRQRLALYFMAGICAGVCPIMKQPGIVFTAFVFALWLWDEVHRGREWQSRMARGMALLAGTVLPFGILVASLWRSHTARTFWLWTVTYARQYGASVPIRESLGELTHNLTAIVDENLGFWILAAIGIVGVLQHRSNRNAVPFVLGLLLFSCLGVVPGFMFRPHYFLMVLPAIALLGGAAVFAVRERLRLQSERFRQIVTCRAHSGPCFDFSLVAPGFLFSIDPRRGMPARRIRETRFWNHCRWPNSFGRGRLPTTGLRFWARSRSFISTHADRRQPDSSIPTLSWKSSHSRTISSDR